jgi:hypothetical protein
LLLSEYLLVGYCIYEDEVFTICEHSFIFA